MNRFTISIGLAILLSITGCYSSKPSDLGISNIGANGGLTPVAIENAPPPPIADQTEIILLPQENGKVGKVIVRDNGKEVILDKAWQKVETSNLDKKEILSKEIIDAKYAQLLKEVPKKPNNYRIYFKNNSTDSVNAIDIFPRLIKDIKSNFALEVDIIGYSDRTGNDEYNKVLSLKRAKRVSMLLIEAGIDSKIIVINYHGEKNPVVETEDGVANELNRRVEVTVK
ncbi:MAG: outer membrane protein OmpA-like peptidoglycan-associated protein [Sulfurimonas sp.]|jgi:outer membrane protein OmpA-like peptidoglycan-associated protein